MTLPFDAPGADEIEVSIFGKGLGEAIVAHFGGGKWVTIDSIGLEGKSATRIYLEEIGVDVANQVDVVVATHWHDDHVKGLSDLFSHASGAELVISSAMLDNEFAKFIAAFSGQIGRKFSSGVEEIGKVITIAASRKATGSRWPVVQPGPGQPLWRRPAGVLPHGQAVTLEALSPSNYDQTLFLARVAKQRPDPRVLQQAPMPGPNDLSVALHLTLGDDAVLFGADLENTRTADSGWDAVLQSSVRPTALASLVKVPHHGGLSGHHAGMWSNLATAKPLAAVTPWQRGGRSLPTKTDVTRLLSLASDAYITSPSSTLVGPPQPTIVAKALRKGNLSLRRLSNTLGHIRHRATWVGGMLQWRTEIFGAACPIQDVAA